MDNYVLFAICMLMPIYVGHCSPTELTIEVQAGREECFFAPAKPGEYIDVEYQVIDGGNGDIDINFRLISPTGRILVTDIKKSDSTHRLAADEEGDFKACWDNSISRFNNKLVFFEVGVEAEDGNPVWDDIDHDFGATESEVYDMKLQDIQDAVGRVRNQLLQSRHMQDQLRVFEARDRGIAETNYTLVFNWSLLQVVVMLAVGVVQVIMVRSLFDDRSAFNKVWKSAALR